MVLSHPDRKDRIYVFTVDSVLATDLQERISSHPDTWYYEVVQPENGRMSDTIAAIERMALHSVSSRLLILDVRNCTLPRLRHAYNKIVGYSRRDLNSLCYTILIGDGPLNLLDGGGSLDVFGPHLAILRRDYHAAVFFYDPFLHYACDESQALWLGRCDELPEGIPRRLAKGFRQRAASLAAVRRYLRGASLPSDQKEEGRIRRQELLAKFLERRFAEEFPHQRDLGRWSTTKEGYRIAGETLRLHVYPFFFEEWVSELMWKAGRPALRGVCQ